LNICGPPSANRFYLTAIKSSKVKIAQTEHPVQMNLTLRLKVQVELDHMLSHHEEHEGTKRSQNKCTSPLGGLWGKKCSAYVLGMADEYHLI
jgi:hypothetical protein